MPPKRTRPQKDKTTEIAVREKFWFEDRFDAILAEMRASFERTQAESEAAFDVAMEALDFDRARGQIDTLFDNIEQIIDSERDRVEKESQERYGDPDVLMVQALADFTAKQDELDTTLVELQTATNGAVWAAAKVNASLASSVALEPPN